MEDSNMCEYDEYIEEISLNEAMEVDAFGEERAETSPEEKDLQQKYVNGEISFTEYSSKLGALYENLETEDPLENDPEEIAVGLQDLTELTSSGQVEEKEKVNENKKKKELIVKGKVIAEKKTKISRPRVKLEGALKGLLGQATMMFVRKENQQKAIELVLEVVRQCPNSPEAYKTLATMYEEIGDKETAIKMLLIGAHLSRDNAEEWVQLGGHFEKEGDKRQAISCYNKALRADVTLVHIHDRRLQLCDEIDLKNRTFIMIGYQRFLKNITRDSSPQTVLDIATRAAHLCHTMKNLPEAASAMQTALEFCGDIITVTHVNLYLELLLEMKHYETCVNVLQRYAHIKIDYVKINSGPREKEHNMQVISYQLPSPLPPPEIVAKFCVTLVHLRSDTQFSHLINALEMDVESYGDLYLDISEALIQEKYNQHAMEVLKRLIASTKYNQPGVWKQLAETYEKLGLMDECKHAYRTVLEKVPLMVDIRRNLSDIYMKEGKTTEAVDVLRQIAIPGETLPTPSQSMEQDPLENIASIKSENIAQSSQAIPKPQRLEAFRSSNGSVGKKSKSPKTAKSKTSKIGTPKTLTYKKPALPALRYKTKYNRTSEPLRLYPVGSKEEIFDGKSELFSCHQLREANDLISAPLLLDQLVLMMKTEQSFEKRDEFFSLLKVLLSQSSILIRDPQEAKVVLTRGRIHKKVDVITAMRGISRNAILDNRQSFQPEGSINTQDLFKVYRHGFDIAKKTEDYSPLTDIILMVFGSPLFVSESLPTAHIDQMTLEASLVLYRTGHMDFCYQLFRIILHRYLDSKAVLNLINLIMIGVSDQNIFRNTMRTFQSKPENFGLNVLYANHCMLAANYRYCINEYTIISKYLDHKHPLYLLLLGCSYSNIACNRGIDKKSLLVTHALAWMRKYRETRGAVMTQEVLYNLGRMYHQLGLLTQAVSCYKQALAAKPCLPQYNLQCEIAYNLYVVYLSSRSFNLARYIISTYLVV